MMGSDFTLSSRGSAFKGASVVTEALRAFFAPPSSADRDLSLDLDTLRRRSRHLFQNNTFSRAMISSFNTNVVGSGIKARPSIGLVDVLGLTQEEADSWSKKTQSLFEIWAKSKKCDAEKRNDFVQIQDLAFKTTMICGDTFVLPCYSKNLSPFGLNLKVLEGDRCKNPFGIMDSDALAQGVEVDKNGAPVAYHFTQKPVWSIDDYTDYVDSVRVPAFDALGNANVIHIYTSDRSDQRRGIPMLAPVILQLKQQERYQDAELMAAVISACFTAVLENNVPEESEDVYGNAEDGAYAVKDFGCSSQPDLEMKPGAVWNLAQGQKVSSLNPQRPNVNYQPFVESIFSEAAAACGVSFEVVLRKFNSSYNAVRAAILESRKTYDRLRHNFISDFCQPVYEKWLEQAILTGVIEAPGFFDNPIKRAIWSSCNWIADAAFLLDPLKETQAIKMQIDEQLISRDTACAMVNGGEYKIVAHEHGNELKIRQAEGIGEPGSVTKTESFSVTSEDAKESALN